VGPDNVTEEAPAATTTATTTTNTTVTEEAPATTTTTNTTNTTVVAVSDVEVVEGSGDHEDEGGADVAEPVAQGEAEAGATGPQDE